MITGHRRKPGLPSKSSLPSRNIRGLVRPSIALRLPFSPQGDLNDSCVKPRSGLSFESHGRPRLSGGRVGRDQRKVSKLARSRALASPIRASTNHASIEPPPPDDGAAVEAADAAAEMVNVALLLVTLPSSLVTTAV